MLTLLKRGARRAANPAANGRRPSETPCPQHYTSPGLCRALSPHALWQRKRLGLSEGRLWPLVARMPRFSLLASTFGRTAPQVAPCLAGVQFVSRQCRTTLPPTGHRPCRWTRLPSWNAQKKRARDSPPRSFCGASVAFTEFRRFGSIG